MDLRRLDGEPAARWALGLIAVGLPVALLATWRLDQAAMLTLRARVSEDGGWQPATLRASVEAPLDLRMISDDVVHGFAIGRVDMEPIDLPPGEVVTARLIFHQPGTYTYYCTRWCGADHWRMRGVIEVTGPGSPLPPPEPALYLSLGIDLDAERPPALAPTQRPSAARGEALGIALPTGDRTRHDFVTRAPAEIWESLRAAPTTNGVGDDAVWDLVAFLWKSSTSAAALEEGRRLYAVNCAACHGEDGRGEGVLAPEATVHAAGPETHPAEPADFADPEKMLSASSALLHGKIVRGGMGTGMPYWGPILTEAQSWALTDFLWTFQFEEGQ